MLGSVLRRSAHMPKFRCLSGYNTEPTYKYPKRENDFSERPNYPPIEEISDEALARKTERELCDRLKSQPTVEEKIFFVNVPRFWGWKCFMVHEGIIPFNSLNFAQHVTRTHLIRNNALPDFYDPLKKKAASLAQQIQQYVKDSIEYQLDVRHDKLHRELNDFEREKEITRIVVNELNRVIINSISSDEYHMKFLQTDFSPRIEASWKVNSMNETLVVKEYPFGIPVEELPEEYLERPSDKFIQYIGQPILQLRHTHPLPILLDKSSVNIFKYSVPVYEYDPHVVLGYNMERRHITNIPGFWPGDDREFSFLSYHFLNHITQRPPTFGQADAEEAIQNQIIFASFGWLMSLACYQGFSFYNDPTYPLVTQTVATDGRKFVFGAYQLNTTEIHHKNTFENVRSNICWISKEMSLYEKYEDGKLKGFNEQVLQLLLQLYLNKPEPLAGVKLKPYLGQDIKHIADYEDSEKREWLERKFKNFSSNRPPGKPFLMYEVYDWERIFKIQFRMRPRDKRIRPFELRQNPYHKKMSDHIGTYIPKALRPDKDLPKWRQRKYAKTFYPK